MARTIKMLTLNCWGVFSPDCSYRPERIAAISAKLAEGEYDIVLLQEIWTQSDYQKLCDKIIPVMPYTHYFHSGVFGSGICIFSKHFITETFQYRFSLNGYAHKFWHGDWAGGKCVGLAKINFNDIRICVYVAHLHAQYHEEGDEYLAHRIVQSHEMSQFIKMTSESCDVVVVGGDFNLQPKDLGYKLIQLNANLKDSWLEQKVPPVDDIGATCERPDNTFSSSASLKFYPQGMRLDYLMYRANAGFDMRCEKCNITMEKIPGKEYHYSDHEGVEAVYIIRRNITAMGPTRDTTSIERYYTDALPIINQGLQKVMADRVFFAVFLIISFVALTFTSDLTLPYGLDYLTVFIRFLLVLLTGFSMWMGVVMSCREINSLTAAKKDINNLLKGNPEG